jgi:hypothetical protein
MLMNDSLPDGPIYIGGLSYSGKTQLRLMLDCHPDLSLTRRTYMWPRFFGRFGDLGRDENLARCLDAMLASSGIRKLSPERERIEREFRAAISPGEGDAAYGRLFALFHRHHAERLGKRRWGDQLGHVEQYADPIFAAQPAARMIHMVRDPRARYRVIAGRGRARPGKPGWETMAWRRSAELGLRHSRRYAGRYLVVRYEDLLTETEPTLSEVCAFLGETCYAEMIPGSATSLLDGTIWGSPTPANPSRGAGRAAEFIERQAGSEMAAFGYERAQTGEPAMSRSRQLWQLINEPFNRAGVLAWRMFGSN